MDAKIDILDEIHQHINDAFASQDPELFDVVFEIEGKKLYADKLRLSVISSTFKSMLSNHWHRNKNEAIQIKTCSFEDFKYFLTYIYSGKCNINRGNLFAMLDLAEFYQIKQLKELCDEHLAKTKVSWENVFQLMETSNKYSLVHVKSPLNDFIYQHFNDLIKMEDKILNAEKAVIEELLSLKLNLLKEKEIFPMVYKWVENYAKKKQEELNDENYNLNDAIKAELISFAKYAPFKKTKLDFLNNYAGSKDIKFSNMEKNNVLVDAKTEPLVKVKVTNSIGQSIHGTLSYDTNIDAIKVMKSLKNRPSENKGNSFILWNTNCKIPSTPNPLKRKIYIEWYLILFQNGYIGVRDSSEIHGSNYLLAAMTPDDSGFKITTKCKIEIIE